MSLRRDLMVLVHFFNQSLWWLSSTFGPKRSRDGRSRCAWRLPWLWFFRWGCTALGTGRSNAFSRLIRCNFDSAGLSHSRTRRCFEVHREHVSSNSIHRSTGLERKLVKFTERQYQLATSVSIGGHMREHCHLQLSLGILQTCRDWTSFCLAGWPSEIQYQV